MDERPALLHDQGIVVFPHGVDFDCLWYQGIAGWTHEIVWQGDNLGRPDVDGYSDHEVSKRLPMGLVILACFFFCASKDLS